MKWLLKTSQVMRCTSICICDSQRPTKQSSNPVNHQEWNTGSNTGKAHRTVGTSQKKSWMLRKGWYSSVMKKKCQPRRLYPAKQSCDNEGGIAFYRQAAPRGFVTTRRGCNKCFKDFHLQKWKHSVFITRTMNNFGKEGLILACGFTVKKTWWLRLWPWCRSLCLVIIVRRQKARKDIGQSQAEAVGSSPVTSFHQPGLIS